MLDLEVGVALRGLAGLLESNGQHSRGAEVAAADDDRLQKIAVAGGIGARPVLANQANEFRSHEERRRPVPARAGTKSPDGLTASSTCAHATEARCARASPGPLCPEGCSACP